MIPARGDSRYVLARPRKLDHATVVRSAPTTSFVRHLPHTASFPRCSRLRRGGAAAYAAAGQQRTLGRPRPDRAVGHARFLSFHAYSRPSSSPPAESPSNQVLDGPWMLSHHSLDVDGWASPAHPSPSIRVFDGIPLGFGWALDVRSEMMA